MGKPARAVPEAAEGEDGEGGVMDAGGGEASMKEPARAGVRQSRGRKEGREEG